ncbi:mannosyl phosphorylinositol ceramide synthase protein [Purpureocillium lavendulum]|uniref:Mannosyl phosphorylinositol ceramide synthase protein n=1 Tax=Purpureocillium lavendulum TaxID=1247861 RepID=A0AB34G0L0_9HYPO|nr:mannosyl phosphorylinositol ceramide synthase protein [Purpureocillium lavendulum]
MGHIPVRAVQHKALTASRRNKCAGQHLYARPSPAIRPLVTLRTMGTRAIRLMARKPVHLSFTALCLLLLIYVGVKINFFVHIFLQHSGVHLTQAEIAQAHNATTPDPRPRVVPPIIHQIYHNWKDPGNETIPALWDGARKTCIDLHPEWEYKLWTEKSSRDFIAKEYSWFLETYDNFKFPVQKVDALRYLLMRHYGGIYIDLDDAKPLLYYPVWVTDGGHGALSNNILGAAPNHPFWELATESMVSYAWNYPFPYVTISYATGQWFLTDMWQRYHASLAGGEPELTRVMMDMRPGAATWVFFMHTKGGSWDNWDNHVFQWVGSHLVVTVLAGIAVVGTLGAMLVLVVRLGKVLLRRRKGYRLV